MVRHFFKYFWGHVPGTFGGSTKSFSRKFGGCQGYHLASSEVPKKGFINLKNVFFDPTNIFSKRSGNVILCITRPSEYSQLLSRAISRIFYFFHIFPFFPPPRAPINPFWALKGGRRKCGSHFDAQGLLSTTKVPFVQPKSPSYNQSPLLLINIS